MSQPRDRIQTGPGRVQHAENADTRTDGPPAPEPRYCARCQRPHSSRGSRRARYCSATCRHADVRERRAVARADLLAALAQLAQATERVQRALKVMGFRPERPRSAKHPRQP